MTSDLAHAPSIGRDARVSAANDGTASAHPVWGCPTRAPYPDGVEGRMLRR